MAYKSNKVGVILKLGISKNWKIINYKKKNNNLILEHFFIKKIFDFFEFTNIIPRKHRTLAEDLLHVPFMIGKYHCNITQKISIFFNYYFDFNKIKRYFKHIFFCKIIKNLFFLKFFTKKNITIKARNYFKYLKKIYFLPEVFEPNKILKKNEKKINFFLVDIRNEYYTTFLIDYELFWHKRNIYYLRISNILLISFFFKDAILYAKIIAYELANMRSKHKALIAMISNLTQYCVDQIALTYSKKFTFFDKDNCLLNELATVGGVRILFKGRITPGTRQNRRKQKLWISAGILNFNSKTHPIDYGESLAITRFGTLNIKVWFGTYQEERYFDPMGMEYSHIFI